MTIRFSKNLSRIWVGIILICFPYTLYAQTGKIKRTVMVTSKYDYYNYKYDSLKKKYVPENGIWKPNVERDTVIWEYNTVTKETVRIPTEDSNSRGYSRDSIVLISQTRSVKHQREYWPKPFKNRDIYTYTFKDSVIQMEISETGDTMRWRKEFFKRGRTSSIYFFEGGNHSGPSLEVYRYESNNKLFIKGHIIKTYEKRTKADTTFLGGNYWRKVYRKIDFTPEQNERYTVEKKIVYKRKIVEYNTFYHDYWKRYFTTKTVDYYKRDKEISKTIQYDAYEKIEKIIIFYKE